MEQINKLLNEDLPSFIKEAISKGSIFDEVKIKRNLLRLFNRDNMVIVSLKKIKIELKNEYLIIFIETTVFYDKKWINVERKYKMKL